MTTPVAAPGDTSPSDATAKTWMFTKNLKNLWVIVTVLIVAKCTC